MRINREPVVRAHVCHDIPNFMDGPPTPDVDMIVSHPGSRPGLAIVDVWAVINEGDATLQRRCWDRIAVDLATGAAWATSEYDWASKTLVESVIDTINAAFTAFDEMPGWATQLCDVLFDWATERARTIDYLRLSVEEVAP